MRRQFVYYYKYYYHIIILIRDRVRRLCVYTAVANTAPQIPILYNNIIVKDRVPYATVLHRKPVHIIIGII